MKTRYFTILCAITGFGLMAMLSPNTHADEAARRMLRDHQIAGRDAERIIAYFNESEELGLPTEFLRLRLREGVTKQVDVEQIQAALAQRMQMLKQARKLSPRDAVTPDHHRRRRSRPDTSVETLARALESGLPFDMLEAFYASTRDTALAMRLHPIVEAGEMMHLAGVDMESVRHFMHDCRDRRLGRMETLRAARFWIDKHDRNINGETIRRQLWGEIPSHDRDPRHDPKYHRQREREPPSRRARPAPAKTAPSRRSPDGQ